MELTGKIIKVMPKTEGITKQGKAWQKQEYLLETDDRYPRQICVEALGEDVDKLGLQMGFGYTLQVDLSSREYNGRYYTQVRVWRAEKKQ